eukprot:5872383-Pleurochrysis_carterae.AAC.1
MSKEERDEMHWQDPHAAFELVVAVFKQARSTQRLALAAHRPGASASWRCCFAPQARRAYTRTCARAHHSSSWNVVLWHRGVIWPSALLDSTRALFSRAALSVRAPSPAIDALGLSSIVGDCS